MTTSLAAAVGKWPACARLSAVAPAGHLPTAPTPLGGTQPDLRTQANAILHINKGVTEVEEKNEKQFEMRMVEFFGTVRALIEGVK